jgi:hypothetical protein
LASRSGRELIAQGFELVESIELPSRLPVQPPRAVRAPPDDPLLEYETVPADTRTSNGPDIDIPGLDLEEGVLLLVPLALVLGGSLDAFYAIYSAPILFAELILDGVIVASLYRRCRHLAPEGWLPIAVRRTRMPFVALFWLSPPLVWPPRIWRPALIRLVICSDHRMPAEARQRRNRHATGYFTSTGS